MRYERHLALPEFGVEGQRRLGDARVLVVGAGGLGSPASLYLTAAGVGTLGLVDFDAVDESNLQRQILYAAADVGAPKLAAAAARLRALNPDVTLELCHEPFSADNGRRLVDAYDVIIDGTDNFPTRYLVNDACVLSRRPNVYGSVFRFEGQASVFSAQAAESGQPAGPCYRCLHPEPPPDGLIPNCAEGGVLGVLPGVIGMIQATEAIKLVTGIGAPLVGRLLLYDALKLKFREIGLPRDPDCPVCGDHPTIRELVAYDRTCEPDQLHHPAVRAETNVTVETLDRWRRAARPHTLVDVREHAELAIAQIEGALHIPLAELTHRLDQLPTDRPVVVFCKSGGRSRRATAALRERGFDAHNLTGGILAWAAEIDPSTPRY